jgi:hypothetical protein
MGRDAMAKMQVSPITDADMGRVGEFLHAHLNRRVPADDWARSLDVPWSVDSPNHGFMLLQDARIVGAYLAFYSERMIGGRSERFCNLGAWCVLSDYRFHSLRLLNALLAQPGYHFTDLSPSGNTVPVNLRSKFKFLDTTTALIPNLPWPSWPGRSVISSDRVLIGRTLTGRDLEVYRDHANTRAAHHLLLLRGGESCYVVFRRDRRRNLPLFASILHVSNRGLFRRMVRPLARYLLFHYGVLATLAELRIVTFRPWPSLILRSPRPKMFKSPHLEPAQIDYLYSELVCVAW